MKLLDAGFQMKKGWERLAQEKKDEISHSLPVYRVPIYLKEEQLFPMTEFEGEGEVLVIRIRQILSTNMRTVRIAN